MAAEVLRYKATGIEEAKRNAWSLYRGMKFLIEVTGISGLPARSVVRDDDNHTDNIGDDWHASVTNPGWLWKGDTSSDEVFFLSLSLSSKTSLFFSFIFFSFLQIAGHIFAYTLVYDLIADTLNERLNVALTLDSVMSKSCMHVASLFLYLSLY